MSNNFNLTLITLLLIRKGTAVAPAVPSPAPASAPTPAVAAEEANGKGKDKQLQQVGFYSKLMKEFPYIMNATQSAIVACLSSMTSSWLNKEETNWADALLWMVLNVVYITPVLLLFYRWLDSKKCWENWQKVAFDQAIFSPIFTFVLLTGRNVAKPLFEQVVKQVDVKTMTSASLIAVLRNVQLEGTLLAQVQMHAQAVLEILPKVCVSNWSFWIPARFMMLSLIAPELHLISGTLLSFVWNIILSSILNDKKK